MCCRCLPAALQLQIPRCVHFFWLFPCVTPLWAVSFRPSLTLLYCFQQYANSGCSSKDEDIQLPPGDVDFKVTMATVWIGSSHFWLIWYLFVLISLICRCLGLFQLRLKPAHNINRTWTLFGTEKNKSFPQVPGSFMNAISRQPDIRKSAGYPALP